MLMPNDNEHNDLNIIFGFHKRLKNKNIRSHQKFKKFQMFNTESPCSYFDGGCSETNNKNLIRHHIFVHSIRKRGASARRLMISMNANVCHNELFVTWKNFIIFWIFRSFFFIHLLRGRKLMEIYLIVNFVEGRKEKKNGMLWIQNANDNLMRWNERVQKVWEMSCKKNV